MDKQINVFIIFCIEKYKFCKKIDGEEAYNLFEKYGLFKYLTDGYDVLHTQGEDYIINDICEYIDLRK